MDEEPLDLSPAPPARRGRWRVLALVGAGVTLAAVAAVMGGSSSPGTGDETATDEATTSTTADDSTTTSMSDTTTSTAGDDGTTTTVDAADLEAPIHDGEEGSHAPTTEPPGSTTTTVPACTDEFDSFDPDCGPFRWVTKPQPNQEMTSSLELLTADPVLGQPIDVRVRASDADATPVFSGDLWPEEDALPSDFEAYCGPSKGGYDAFGTWRLPPRSHGDIDEVHTYSHPSLEAGKTYRLYACVVSLSWPLPPPGTDDEVFGSCPGDPNLFAGHGVGRCRSPWSDLQFPYVEVTFRQP